MAVQRTISSAGASWAGFSAWAETAPPTLFLFFVQTIFPFLFLKQKTLFCNRICIDLNLFKFATISKRARGFGSNTK
jgi:hypothetical protein